MITSIKIDETKLHEPKSNEIIYSVDFLENVLQTALELHLPIAIWRLPVHVEGGNRHIVIDFSGKTKLLKPNLENLPAGFVVSPFVQTDEKVHFIEANFHYQSQNGAYFITENIDESRENRKEFLVQIGIAKQNIKANNSPNNIINKFKKLDNQVDTKNHEIADYENIPKNTQENIHAQIDFENIVAQAICNMQQNKFQKVVLSRTKTVDLEAGFELAKAFEKLCHLYPHAFISLVCADEFGTWIGASPEILISSDKNKMFRTIALAGTQAKGTITNLQEAMWRQKEIEEQALVSRYIINCFKKVRVREYEEEGPKTVVAGNLMHLRTDFEVDTQAINFPELATVMLELLHPTSAVCGMPKPEALDFILKNEKHDRKLYAGYLGQVNINEETHLFVNLRCMEILNQQAILYAGGGITKDSVPEREWLETELKCKTVAQAFLD